MQILLILTKLTIITILLIIAIIIIIIKFLNDNDKSIKYLFIKSIRERFYFICNYIII